MEDIHEKLPNDFLKKIYTNLVVRCDYHESHAKSEKKIYRTLGYTLNVVIPVLSAVIAFLSGKVTEGSNMGLGILSLILAVLAVINSTIKPSERYAYLAHKLILLHDWKFELDLKLQRILTSETDKLENIIYDYFETKNKIMSDIGQDLATTKLPDNNK
ncbi:MAG: hypothetical protein QTN59_10250 [Candidatus Electrothrix communis]|nr:MAG: hypothetical protein QTN59_10250 [Candidatus Electrothrix communis]